MYRITPIVKNLLIINTIVFLIDAVTGGMINRMLSLKFVLADDFIIIQFFSYMWLHGDFFHLLFNMIALFFFGPILEQLWGGKKFLQFYVITGIGAGLLYALANFAVIYQDISASEKYLDNPTSKAFTQYIMKDLSRQALRGFDKQKLSTLNDTYYENPDNESVRSNTIYVATQVYDAAVQGYSAPGIGMVGASGAVYGILFAVVFLFPNMTIMLLFPPIPIKMKYLVLFMGAYALWSQINRVEGDNVAHLAHLGGMLIGFILLKVWKKSGNSYY